MRKLLIAAVLLSGPAPAADLMQLYQDALLNDSEYAAARHARGAQREHLPRARAGLLPTVVASGALSRNDADSDIDGGAARPYDWDARRFKVALTQPLLRVANWRQYQQGQLLAEEGELALALARQQLMLRLCQAYFGVLTAQDALSAARAQRQAIGEQLDRARHNFEIGDATSADTHEAQARLDLASANESAERGNLEVRRGALEAIIGKPGGELAALPDGVELLPPQPADPEAWAALAVGNNHNVTRQRLRAEIAAREIDKVRAGRLPTVDLVVSRGHVNQNGDSPLLGRNVTTSNSIGIQVNIPIFSGFGVDSQVRQAVELREVANAELETARRTAAQDVRAAYFRMTSALARGAALEAARRSSRLALDSNRFGYEVGMRINIDVLNAQQQLFATQTQLSAVRYEAILDGLRLKAAAGSLQEADVEQVNALLKR